MGERQLKLTAAQRETLRVLGDGDWYEVGRCADEFRRTFRSLIRRGLLKRRGGIGQRPWRRPIEVAITDAGRQARQETPHD